MKKILIILFSGILLQSCHHGEDYKAIRTSMLDKHDKVMMDSESAYKNKKNLDALVMRLDSLKKLYSEIDTVQEKQEINELRNKLNKADDQMNDWMHKLEAEIGNKSNDEAVAYFKAEKMKINVIDSLYAQIIKQSDNYLSKFKKK